jgi:hypothetical protein
MGLVLALVNDRRTWQDWGCVRPHYHVLPSPTPDGEREVIHTPEKMTGCGCHRRSRLPRQAHSSKRLNYSPEDRIRGSHGRPFQLLQKMNLGLPRNTGPLHRLAQIVGLNELASPLHIRPL